MATWKNLDTLASYSKLAELKGHVNIADAMAYGASSAVHVKGNRLCRYKAAVYNGNEYPETLCCSSYSYGDGQ